ncbi:MAG: hypothetical protein CVU63_06700 [Deltaproteobacteria bacterium HGW-Deltaproteobacteria-20]|nr:MAG: hypothetical protein CVU63_06700 [Deltaproteobacteria bacterium HGW-Deltaproteobacteria-20]
MSPSIPIGRRVARTLAPAMLTAGVIVGASPLARADNPAPARHDQPADPAPRTQPRPVPDYDGRGPDPEGDGALWVPRVLAFPFYLLAEYVVRRPMEWLVVTAERDDWPTAILDFFTFDSSHQIGIVPTAFFDFGFKPSVGLYFFADDLFVDDNDLRVNLGFWGTDWLKVAARDRVNLGEDRTVEIGGGWLRRPDYLFHGLGPRSLEKHASRYSADTSEAFLAYDVGLWRMSSLKAQVGYRDRAFREASCCDDPSIQQRALRGQLAVPPAFDDGYTAGYARLGAALDTRLPDPHPGHGVRIEGHLEQDTEVDPDRAPARWMRYGGKIGGFVDLTGHRRVLSLWLSGSFVDPLGGSDVVPFTELATLGGEQDMRAFREGRLLGRSALASTLQYEWPVWVWLRGTLQLATGNVFGNQMDDFDPRLLRLASSLGLRSIGSTDHYLEIMTGVGTETYEEGWDVTSFRLLVGGNSGF